MKKIFILITLSFIIFDIIVAQENLKPVPDSEKNLNFMLGDWEGEGWMMTKSGREFTKVTEKAQCKLGCNIIVVDGLGLKTDSLTGQTTIVHDAFGVIFKDSKTDLYTIRAYKKEDITETVIEFIDHKKIRWNLTTPNGGKVRFTADFNAENKWLEIGEFNRGGDQWIKFMEMDLTKVQD